MEVKQKVNESDKSKKQKKIKCAYCKKKLGLLGFKCKCNLMYCLEHLQPESHNCTFDYRQEQCKKLEKSLLKVINSKIPSI